MIMMVVVHFLTSMFAQKLMYQVGGALPTKVVCLTQVVSADELRDDEEYVDIVEDMREEGRKYGILHETLDFCPFFFKLLYSVSY
jgi:splicing factor U2AF subunit